MWNREQKPSAAVRTESEQTLLDDGDGGGEGVASSVALSGLG